MIKKFDWLPAERTCGCPKDSQNCLTTDEWFRYQVPIWRFSKRELLGGFERYSRGVHPAVFPRVLVRRLIELYTHRGQTVLDTFAGVGTTLVSALELGRNAIGLELNPRYTAVAKRRLTYIRAQVRDRQRRAGCRRTIPNGHLFNADARDLLSLLPPNTVDLVVTSPPYWDLLKQRQSLRNRKSGKHLKSNYSNDKKDLSNAGTLAEFLGEMGGIFYQVSHVLRPGGRLVIITGDYRRRGDYIPLHERYIRMLEGIGLKLNNIIIWDRSSEYEIGLFGYPRYFIAANGMVEYIMEFIYPNPKFEYRNTKQTLNTKL